MEWWQVQWKIPREAAEALAAVVQDWPEVQGVMTEGDTPPDPMHPEWGEWFDESLLVTDEVTVTVFVPQAVARAELESRSGRAMQVLTEAGLGDLSKRAAVITGVAESDWENAWKDGFEIMSVGEKLRIVPLWRVDEVPDDSRIDVVIEPGMAFGTGVHPTTQLCMRALERLPLSGKAVVDIGCGTGILAITAAKLGATSVTASDLDIVACDAAANNVRLNELSDVVTISNADLLLGIENLQADVLVANILRDIVIRLTPQAAKLLEKGAWFVVSGFVESQAKAVEEALISHGFVPTLRLTEEDWVSIGAVKS